MNNLGIIISFVIGGLLIVAILTLNGRVIQNSGETVLNMSAKQTTRTISEIMRRDFQRLGYNLGSGCNQPIASFSSTHITFCADVDSVRATTASQITWQLSTDSVTTTGNPRDVYLYRRTSGTQAAQFPVTAFKFRFADQNGDSIYTGGNRSRIRKIFAEITAQSPEQYGDNGYSKSFMEKAYMPPSLKIEDRQW